MRPVQTLCPAKYIWAVMQEILSLWFTTYPATKTTVKPVLSGHTKIDKTKILMTNSRVMKVERIAECSHWSILQYF